MTFKKGQSGNPSGRPKDADLRKLARTRTADAINTLTEIMKDKAAPEAMRITAANSLLDRGWGKPVQPQAFTDIGGNDRVLPFDGTALDTARRIAFVLHQGLKALPNQQPALEQANRENDLQRPIESSTDSEAYRELPDDDAEEAM